MDGAQTKCKGVTRREFLHSVGAGALGITTLGLSGYIRGDKMTGKRPNLLFITTDHQRADSIGMVQAGIEVAPSLSRLASQGIVFTRAYSTCPLCVPARTALATGKYPTKNGVVFNDWKGLSAGNHNPIHQYLAEVGYSVGHIGIHHVRVRPTLQERVQFGKWIGNAEYVRYLNDRGVDIDAEPPGGLDSFRKEVIENQNGRSVRIRYSNTRTAVWPPLEEHFKDNYFCQQSVDFIHQSRTKPFALFVNIRAPHPPLWAPEPYASRFDPEDIELPPNVDLPAEGEPPSRRRSVPAQLAENVSMDEWRKVWAAHLGLVNLADAGIGRILQALEASGQGENTIILFTVDHGDHLGQHRMYQKMEMYEQAIKVPLVIRVPGTKAQTFDSPVSHLDVMPTMLDLVDIGLPDDLDGVSLLDSIVSGTPPPDRSAFSQYSGNPTVGDIRRAVITRRYKYIYDPADAPELYNLESDPLEMHNLAANGKYTKVIRELHEECESWAKEHGDWVKF